MNEIEHTSLKKTTKKTSDMMWEKLLGSKSLVET
jgi:hypothetical protein